MDLRQDSYIRREDELKAEAAEAHETARAAIAQRDAKAHYTTKDIEALYSEVTTGVEHLRERVITEARLDLAHHESDMLKGFRQRLYTAESDAAAAKVEAAAMAKQGAWPLVESLRSRVAEYQSVALELDGRFSAAQEEVIRLRQTCHLYETEYEVMTRQMAMVKHDATSYKLELGRRAAADAALPVVAPAAPAVAESAPHRGLDFTQVMRQQAELIAKLQKQIGLERQHLRAVTDKHLAEAASRTEMQGLLRSSLESVRADIARYSGGGGKASAGGGSPPALSAEQRDQVLAVLLSKERVCELLLDKTFPHAAPGYGSGHALERTLVEKPPPAKGGWGGMDANESMRAFLKAKS